MRMRRRKAATKKTKRDTSPDLQSPARTVRSKRGITTVALLKVDRRKVIPSL